MDLEISDLLRNAYPTTPNISHDSTFAEVWRQRVWVWRKIWVFRPLRARIITFTPVTWWKLAAWTSTGTQILSGNGSWGRNNSTRRRTLTYPRMHPYGSQLPARSWCYIAFQFLKSWGHTGQRLRWLTMMLDSFFFVDIHHSYPGEQLRYCVKPFE